MTNMKKTTVSLRESDRAKAEVLMKRYNLSSLGQLIRFLLEKAGREE